jgi:hypothetical protein
VIRAFAVTVAGVMPIAKEPIVARDAACPAGPPVSRRCGVAVLTLSVRITLRVVVTNSGDQAKSTHQLVSAFASATNVSGASGIVGQAVHAFVLR